MGSYNMSPKRRQSIYARDNYVCAYCGRKQPASRLTLDHIKPQAQGGTNQPSNLVTSCATCNMRKGNKTLAQYCEWLILDGWPVSIKHLKSRVNRFRRRKLVRV